MATKLKSTKEKNTEEIKLSKDEIKAEKARIKEAERLAKEARIAARKKDKKGKAADEAPPFIPPNEAVLPKLPIKPQKNIIAPQKPKNPFAGLVSWLCMMAYICLLPFSVLFFLMMLSGKEAANRIEELLSYISYLSDFSSLSYDIQSQIAAIAALLILSFFLIIIFRKDRRALEACFAYGLSYVWIEIKVVAAAIALYLSVQYLSTTAVIVVSVLLIYLICLDFGHNGNIFKHNIVHSIITNINNDGQKTPYEMLSMRRLVSTFAIIAGVIVIGVAGAFFITTSMPFSSISVNIVALVSLIVFAIAGITGTIMWFALNQRRDLRDLGEIMAQIEEMYEGNLNAVNNIPPSSNFYDSAMQLNMIRTGIEKAVEEGMRADMTKVELITNVSHDIKTPLTSIITYVDLLKREANLEPHVKDYINIIATKADRLSHIVQDVFEVSKAATGNISLDLENIDVVTLLKQTIAEMDYTMQSAKVDWRTDISEMPLMINADGQKLYRVFQNLIKNCSQYALPGSRAHISLRQSFGYAQFSIKNISKNEIDPAAAENLTERFVRGDTNRTTEGTGLGLSIAKSFTEANGGTFDVKTDGDIFVVTVQFPLVQQSVPVVSDATGPIAVPVSEGVAHFEQKIDQMLLKPDEQNAQTGSEKK